MGTLPAVVRPFQTVDVGPAAKAESASTIAAPQNIVIKYGENGNPKTFNGNYDLSISYYNIKRMRERPKTT